MELNKIASTASARRLPARSDEEQMDADGKPLVHVDASSGAEHGRPNIHNSPPLSDARSVHATGALKGASNSRREEDTPMPTSCARRCRKSGWTT